MKFWSRDGKEIPRKPIKYTLKMNFFYLTLIIYCLAIVIIASVLMTGNTIESTNEGTTNENPTGGNTHTMNAEKLFNDMIINSDWSTYLTMSYSSLDEGDTLIVHDIISEISYDTSVDATHIMVGLGSAKISFWFEGDITDTYAVGDEVKITLTVNHVTFSNEGMSYDLELFSEVWESEEYYIANMGTTLQGLKPIQSSAIVKV